jgi:non-heme chloroperoxidase
MRATTGAALAVGAVAGAAAGALLAERALVALVQRNPDPHAGEDLSEPEGSEHRVEVGDGAILRVIEAGEGPPIVLAHGYMVSMYNWSAVFGPLVAAGHRVLAYDQRGHGSSTIGGRGLGLEAIGADLADLLAHFDLTDAVVVGHSMGGIGLMNFAIRFPEERRRRVAGLVFMSTTPHSGPLFIWRNRLQRELIAHPLTFWGLSHPVHGTVSILPLFGSDPAPSHVEATRRVLAQCPPDVAVGALEPMTRFDYGADLSAVDTPALVLTGSKDRLLPSRVSRTLARMLPDSRLEVFPGAGHILALERADQVAVSILRFAAEVQRDGTVTP